MANFDISIFTQKNIGALQISMDNFSSFSHIITFDGG
jgi:hypothetical protein